jgi:hypothetical protein
MDMINPDDINFIFKNPTDIKTGLSRGYTIGFKNGRKEVVGDEVGDKIALVMEARAKKEYKGRLVTPSGNPLNEVMENNMTKIDDRVLNDANRSDEGFVHKRNRPT